MKQQPQAICFFDALRWRWRRKIQISEKIFQSFHPWIDPQGPASQLRSWHSQISAYFAFGRISQDTRGVLAATNCHVAIEAITVSSWLRQGNQLIMSNSLHAARPIIQHWHLFYQRENLSWRALIILYRCKRAHALRGCRNVWRKALLKLQFNTTSALLPTTRSSKRASCDVAYTLSVTCLQQQSGSHYRFL